MRALLAVRYEGMRQGRRVTGIVHAPGFAPARARAAALGVVGARMRISWRATWLAWVHPRFDAFDLETFYGFLARALDRGYSRPAMLADAAEIVHDARLRIAVATLRDLVQEGSGLGRAMAAAGFPARDSHLALAGEEAGNLVATLASLAREVRREAELRRSLRRMLLSPAILGIAAYVLSWCALVLLSPSLGRVLTENAQVLSLPAYARAYYGFVRIFNEHLALSSLLYAAGGLGLASFLRSRACRELLESLVPAFARISELADMSRMWGAFSAMLQGGMAPAAIARQLAAASERGESRTWFLRLERQCLLGVATDRAVERAGFPRYVVAGIKAACGSGALVEGSGELAERLSIQVSMLTHRAQSLVGAACALLGACIVLGFAAITILPQMSSLLGSF
jgi:type II secretory pathway component PulF